MTEWWRGSKTLAQAVLSIRGRKATLSHRFVHPKAPYFQQHASFTPEAREEDGKNNKEVFFKKAKALPEHI
jgi:hypothetical protein